MNYKFHFNVTILLLMIFVAGDIFAQRSIFVELEEQSVQQQTLASTQDGDQASLGGISVRKA